MLLNDLLLVMEVLWIDHATHEEACARLLAAGERTGVTGGLDQLHDHAPGSDRGGAGLRRSLPRAWLSPHPRLKASRPAGSGRPGPETSEEGPIRRRSAMAT